MSSEPILDLYIEVNILLAAVYLLWCLTQFVLNYFGWQTNHRWQQVSLRLLLIFVIFSPIFVRTLPPDITIDWHNSGRSITFNYFSNLAGVDSYPLNPNSDDSYKQHHYNVLTTNNIDKQSDIYEDVLLSTWPWKPVLLNDAPIVAEIEKSLPGNPTEPSTLVIELLMLLLTFSLCFSQLCWRWLIQLKRLYSLLDGSHQWKHFGSVKLLVSDAVKSPFATALFRKSYIVIPSTLLTSKANLRIAIAHEAQHLRNGDLYWEWGLNILKLILFWNPAIYVWKQEESRLRELACDEFLVHKRHVSTYSYGSCLLYVAESAINFRQRLHGIIGMHSPFSWRQNTLHLKQRIQLLGAFNDRPYVLTKAVALIAPMLLATVLLATFIYARNGWSMTSSQPSYRLGDMHVVHALDRVNHPLQCASWIVTQLNNEGSLVRQCAHLSAYHSIENDYNLTQIKDDDGKVLLKFDPYIPELSFPIKVGKTWGGQYNTYLASAVTGSSNTHNNAWKSNMQCEVVAYEPTKIKIGIFPAYKINCHETRSGDSISADKKINKTLWYSAHAKKIIKQVSDETAWNQEVVRILLK